VILLLLGCPAPRLTDPAELLLRELDADGSGLLEEGEIRGAEIARFDADKDGAWNVEELRAAMGPTP
jgi:hypothetical protein